MEGLVLTWLKRVAWLVPPIIVGLLAYTVATVLRQPVGPLLGKPAGSRQNIALIAFGVTLLIILIILLVKWLRRRRKAGKLEDGLLGGSAGSADRRGEIDALRKTWRQSVAALKTSGAGGGGRRALAVLPWYVIIGAPASGKSTLLRQSGIDFPVGDAAIRGLQGTRNCDWWFSNIGIFLDTAGRYMSDESAAEWAQFLELVRKHRTEAPIQGVIVALPASDLVSKNATDLDADARRIRARLDELIDHLGINFPVWVVLTKVDLVGGFAEMFSHVDAQTRRQMVGWTAEFDEGARFDGAKFETRFRSLVDRLRDVRPVLVGQAPLRERAAAYAFPDEFAALGEPLGAMLRRMFEPNVYQETPLFRGLFVTSATQQGTPLQKAAARVRELLGVGAAPPAAEAVISHAYFVQDLVHERIVPDRHMTWTTRMEIDRGRTKRIGINLTLASAGVFLFFCVIAFGLKAARELEAVETHFDAASGDATGGVERAAALWSAAEKTSDDNYKNLGLSSQRNLKEDLEAAQRDTFRKDVLAGAARALAAEVDETPLSPGPERLIDAWKACRDVRNVIFRARDAAADVTVESFALTDAEKKSFERLRPRLAKERVVAAQRSEYPTDVVACVLRNRPRDDDDRKADKPSYDALEAIDASFARHASEYVTRAAAAVNDVEQNDNAWAQYLEDRLTRFKKTCEEEADRLDRGDLAYEDLVDGTLAHLAAAAAGKSAPTADDLKQGADSERRSLVMSVGSAVAALKAIEAKPPELDAVLRGDAWGKLEKWTAAPAAPGVPTTAPAGVRDSPTRKALEEIVKQLRVLSDGMAGDGLVPDPWPDKAKSVRDALDAIEKDVTAHEKEWRASLEPSLAALGPLPPPPAPSPWRALLLVEPLLRRNAMLRTFLTLERRGGYSFLAKQVVADRQAVAVYDRDALLHDLDELIEIVPTGADDARKLVTTDVTEIASKAMAKQFQKVVDAAREYWNARCADLPAYAGGDPWAYLRKWTASDGAIAMLAAEFNAKFGRGWAPPAGYAGPRQRAARDAWAAADKLRAGYAFYWRDFAELKEALNALVLLSAFSPDDKGKSGFDDLVRGLKSGGNRPVWDAKTLGQKLDPAVTGEGLRTSLENAVKAAENDLLSRVEDYFNQRWKSVRGDLVAGFSDGGAPLVDAAVKRFESFSRDLEPLFGDGLNLEPGGRLAVAEAFRKTSTSLRLWSAFRQAVAKGFTIGFRCTAVPYKKEGGGAADFPYLEIVYVEEGRGGEQRFLWEPNKNDTFPIRYAPGRGAKFQINLLDQQKTVTKTFREWFGTNCLLDAMTEGGGAGGRLAWPGKGDFTGWTNAMFEAQAEDPKLLSDLLSKSRPDPAAELATICVERPGGR